MAKTDQAKDAVEAAGNNKRIVGLGAGLAAALLSAGFLMGKKREQNQSAYNKIRNHLNL